MEELDLDQQIKKLEQKKKRKKRKITLGIIEIVVILVMSVIFVIYNNREECTNSVWEEMWKEEIQSFNSKFLTYEGVQNGGKVRELCDVIRMNNAKNADDQSKRIVLTESAAADPATPDVAGTESAAISTIKSKINFGRRYIVSFGYTSSGLIKNIGIVVK